MLHFGIWDLRFWFTLFLEPISLSWWPSDCRADVPCYGVCVLITGKMLELTFNLKVLAVWHLDWTWDSGFSLEFFSMSTWILSFVAVLVWVTMVWWTMLCYPVHRPGSRGAVEDAHVLGFEIFMKRYLGFPQEQQGCFLWILHHPVVLFTLLLYGTTKIYVPFCVSTSWVPVFEPIPAKPTTTGTGDIAPTYCLEKFGSEISHRRCVVIVRSPVQ